MKKFDFKTFALSCLALGLLFSTPAVYGSEDDDSDDSYTFLAGGSCGAGGNGCGGKGSQPTQPNGGNGTGPVRPVDQTYPQGNQGQGHGCNTTPHLAGSSVDAAKRANLI